MNTEMFAVYVIVAAVVILPYIGFLLFGSTKSKALTKYFNELIKSQNLSISEKEVWNRHVIAVDENSKTLIFVQNNEDDSFFSSIINLEKVLNVEVVQKQNYTRVNGCKQATLDVTGLEFMMTDHTTKVVYFYDNNIDISQNYEFEHAEKWHFKLEKLIRGTGRSNLTAA